MPTWHSFPFRTRGPQIHVQIDVVRRDDVEDRDVTQVVDRVDLLLLTHLDASSGGSPVDDIFGFVGGRDDVERHAQVGEVLEAMQPGVHSVQLRVRHEDRDGKGSLPALDQTVHVRKTVHARMNDAGDMYEVCVT